jgi:hypothetical protein
VDGSKLNPEQIERMLAVIMRQRDYLSRLIERITRFPPDDPIYLATLGAVEKASNLCVVIAKYRSDDNVMTRRPWAG